MEIKVANLQSLEEIISSAVKTTGEKSGEQLIVRFNGLTVKIVYGEEFKRVISLENSNNEIIKEWHNGDIVYDEIIKGLKSLIK